MKWFILEKFKKEGTLLTSLAILILGNTVNPFLLFPDSTDIIIRNCITDASLTSVHYFVAGKAVLYDAGLTGPVPPGSSFRFRVPCRYINRVIIGTDLRGNYRRVGVAPSPSGDTLSISRADKEFGGFFDVILGSRPFVIKSVLPVPITALYILDDSLHTGSLIGSNPLMTDETLFLWMDRDSITIAAMDVEGNLSESIPLARSERDSLFTIGIASFLGDTGQQTPGSIWIINALNGEVIKEIEIYPLTGEPFFIDLSASPLQLWQGVSVPFSGDLEYIVGIDGCNRTFSVDSTDPSTGAFIIDWWHLDFDFDFPERRR